MILHKGSVHLPLSLVQVLRYCHTCPRVIEALMNSYDRVRISEDWVEAVPEEVVQVRECMLLAGEHAAGLPQQDARRGLGQGRAGLGWVEICRAQGDAVGG